MSRETLAPNSSGQTFNEGGFSLLEVLITLLIISLATLALFQSVFQLTSISTKVVNYSENSLDHYVDDILFSRVIGGIIPDWEGNKNHRFSGSDKSLVSVTTFAIQSEVPFQAPLIITIGTSSTGMHRLKFMMGDLEILGEAFKAEDPHFLYLGWDQTWHDKWPHNKILSTGYFDDALYAELPQLPLAVKVVGSGLDQHTHYLARIKQSMTLPPNELAMSGEPQ